jgi:DNA-directed RNA polymerase subunit N (RpoN/RPB10)
VLSENLQLSSLEITKENTELILTARQLSVGLQSWKEDLRNITVKRFCCAVSWLSHVNNEIDMVSHTGIKKILDDAVGAIGMGQYESR